jgi:hypothetical protein
MNVPKQHWNPKQIIGAIIGGLTGLGISLLIVTIVAAMSTWIAWILAYLFLGGIVGRLIRGNSDGVIIGAIVGAILGFLALYLALAGVDCLPPIPFLGLIVWVIVGAVMGGSLGRHAGQVFFTTWVRSWTFWIAITFMTPMVIIALGLQPCSWLDHLLKRSGCLYIIDMGRVGAQYLILTSSGTILATVEWAGDEVELWDISDAELLHTLEEDGDIHGVAISQDGMIVATLSNDEIKLWQASNERLLKTLNRSLNGVEVSRIALSPDGTTLATASDEEGWLWLIKDDVPLYLLWDHSEKDPDERSRQEPETVVFSLDGALLASGHKNGTIKIWNVADGKLMKTLMHTSEGDAYIPVQSLTFSPDSKLLASGAGDIYPNPITSKNPIRLWQVANGTLLRTLDGHDYSILSLAFSLDEMLLASTSNDGTVRLWEINSGILLMTKSVNRVGEGMNSSLTFTSDGLKLATSAWKDKSVWLWKIDQ